MYKLGAVEAEIKSLSDTLETAFKRLEEKIDDTSALNSEKVATLREEVDEYKKRVEVIERWKDQTITRMAMIVGFMIIFWSIFGTALTTRIGNIL
jgi:Na+/phosphate symporter